MHIKAVLTLLFISQALFILPASAEGIENPDPAEAVRMAVSENPAESAPALAALRDQGPDGLHQLFRTYASEIARYSAESPAARASDPRWIRLAAALDAVSQQRDSYASGLYWYTDLDKAKAAARAAGKPILSLRLLGNLTDEFSCANSRFFRAVLYPNSEVSAFMREHFILHWKSVRPAPRVTIDFGDGRKLERTLTGNSIHYVLDPDGRPVDAIPGLCGPKAFLRELMQSESGFRLVASRTGVDRDAALKAFHQAAKRATTAEWQADIARAAVSMKTDDSIAETDGSAKPADLASLVAVSKATVEFKTVRLIGVGPNSPVPPPAVSEATAWEKVAALHGNDVTLDAASLVLIRSQYQTMRPSEEAMTRIIKNLERSLAMDTVRNRYLIHSRIHQWFADGHAPQDLDILNERVYARLFLTPASDPWLGLITPDTYSGLVDDGVNRH